MLNVKLDRNSNYILSCTYGPNSMALLDMLLKEEIKPVVCFINTHKGGNDNENLENLVEFCRDNDLILESFDTEKDLPEKEQYNESLNFNIWSRKVRYSFFKRMYEKYKAVGLFVAHCQDDVLENYLVGKKEGRVISKYGWNAISEQDEMIVIRPLLNYSESDIVEYNLEHKVPYSRRAYQYETQFTKHEIRESYISKLSEIDRDNLIKEMNGEMADEQEFFNGIKTKIETGQELDVRELIALDQNQFTETISELIHLLEPECRITKKLILSIREMCLNPEENMSVKVSDNLFVTKEYDVLTVGGDLKEPLYSYELKKPGKLNTEYFSMDFSNGATDRGFRPSDYPLTIRPAVPSDLFNVHGFMTPIRKLYYDWRMPPKKKLIWPVIANKYGEVLYIPRYHRLHRTDYTSIFEINFKEDE